ncbi:hypothetical protein JOQ06_012516, partial [Pogonophryne albipinna]
LASIRSFRRLEEGFTQVQAWLQDVAEPRLKTLSEAEDSLETLRKKQREFKEFHSTAYDWSRRGSSLLAQMERWDFSERVRTAGQNLEREGRLSSFLDQCVNEGGGQCECGRCRSLSPAAALLLNTP